MDQADKNLKTIIFRSCLAAVWADGNMSVDERSYISYLTETLSENEVEGKSLQDLRFKDVNENELMFEIEQLNKNDKIYVFDKCFDVLKSDKRLNLQELAFLGRLRKKCGVSRLKYHTKLINARKFAKVKISTRRAVLISAVIIPLLFILSIILYESFIKIDINPKEDCSNKEIYFSVLKFDGPQLPEKKTGQDIFKYAQNSILSITVFNKNKLLFEGSGFIIGADDSKNLYIITNKHVVFDEAFEKGKRGDVVRFEVQQHSGAKFDAKLDYYSRDYDIAVLSVDGMEKYAKPIKLTLKSDLNVGQTIYALGSPLSLKDTFTSGVISALREDYLQTDATIYSGSSGGPLIDEYGGVCGIATSGHQIKDYNFAVYSDCIIESLQKRMQKIKSEKSKNE